LARFRLMTYNVHRCVGPGGKDSISEITSLCAEARADVIALQELDAPETDEHEGAHHARDLAAHLGMKLLFCRTFQRGVGYYGHVLLSRDELQLVKVTTFASPHADAEPRGAIWARATLGRGTLETWAWIWQRWASAAFLRGYLEAAKDAPFLPTSAPMTALLLETSILKKALAELRAELRHRPEMAWIPLQGILRIVAAPPLTKPG
jgi:hypothetical protein